MSKEQKARKLIAEQLGVSEESVTMDADFLTDLGADSLDTVELIMAFEEELEVEIDDVDAENLTSLRKVLEFMDKK